MGDAYLPNSLSYSSWFSNPEPGDTGGRIDADSAVVKPDPNGPELSKALEMKRRMARILFEQREVLTREDLNFRWQFREEAPETF